MSEWKPGDPFDDTQPLIGGAVPSVPPPGTLPLPGPPPVSQPVSLPVSEPVSLQKPASGPNDVLVHIGEIQVTATTVHTPNGQFPVAGSQWLVQDQWTMTQKIPTWAIVCAIVGFCVLTVFSLFFLLAKETVMQGFVVVTVSNGPNTFTARFPVAQQLHVSDVHNRVNYVRSLAAS
jgi:hypothetical protein